MRLADLVPGLIVVLLLGGSLAAQPGPGGQEPMSEPKPVPRQAELDGARGKAFAAVVAQLVQGANGNLWLAQSQLQQAAWRQEDPAVRYLLLEEAVGVGERAGSAAVALAGVLQLAVEFEIDVDEYSLALLQRMALAPGENTAATVAIAAWNAAYWRVGDVGAKALLRYHDVAVRAAVRCGRAELFSYLTERLNWLRGWQRLQERLVGASGDLQFERRLQTLGSAARGDRYLLRMPAAHLAPFLRVAPEELGDGAIGDLLPERLAALRERAVDPAVAEALLRAAKGALTSGMQKLDTAGVAARAAQAVEWTEMLATARGVQALRFLRAQDLDQLVCAHGSWRVEEGVLLGRAEGENNFATQRYSFRNTRSVVIRGGIRSAAGLNFRCMVGDVNLLLNWEVADENHLWRNGERRARGPRALVAGKEHTIVFLQHDDEVHVLIDGTSWWTAPGNLDGTITVYPALGSEIFVREILVDGDLDGLVDGPRGVLM